MTRRIAGLERHRSRRARRSSTKALPRPQHAKYAAEQRSAAYFQPCAHCVPEF
ncbi:hypothetical protein [Lysobacter gummosus]|uniref:hypothetical protein n=1 Tax=Lysobacter gummosus TaxID=262324 RepID=UPI00363D114F